MFNKKILIVANTAWNIHNFRRNILHILLDNYFEIVVVTPIDSYLSYLNDFPKVRHIALKSLGRKSTNPLKDIQLTREFVKIYRQEKPDLILHYTIKPNIFGGIAAHLVNMPYICVVTGLGYVFLHSGFVHFISKLLYRFALRNAYKVIFENIDDRLLFIELNLSLPQNSISVKGCGVNTHYFTPKKKKHVFSNRIIFTFIGRFLYDKGLIEFVEAARLVKAQYPQAEFWLVGEIDKSNPSAIQEDELKSWVDEKVISYKGFTNEIRPLIRNSDCVVLPSYREGMPRVLLEAMAMQRCIITTDVSGCREVVDDGINGFLVPVKTVEPLAEAMIKFINLPLEVRYKMAINARKKVEVQFDDRIIAAEFLSIIKSIIQT